MKRLLFLIILFSSIASAQTDSSLFVWVQNGKLYLGSEAFQRWSGHFWDTVATKRYARLVGGGGGGSAQIGDTVMISGGKFYVMKWIEAIDDSVYACADLNGVSIAAGTNTYASGIITTTNYTNPPGSYVTDDQVFDIRICVGVSVSATPGAHNLAEIYFATQIFRKDSVWKTMSDLDYSNAIGGYPYWDDILHLWSADVTTPMSYYVGGSAKYENWYSPAPRNSFWDWGIQPNQPLSWKLDAQKIGRATGQFGRETIGSHTGSIFIFGPRYTWPAHYKTLMTVDTSGRLTVFGDLDTRAGTIKGYDAELSYIRLGFYPTMGDTTYPGYPDTLTGVVMLSSAETGIANLIASGGNALAGFNQTFVFKIDTIMGIKDTVATYGHAPKDFASGIRFETVQADSNVSLSISGKTLKIKAQPPTKFGGSTTNIKYITLDSNLVGHMQSDTLHLAGTATGGGGGAASSSYASSPADKPPASASGFDDEFDLSNGSIIDTVSKWRWLGSVYNRSRLKLAVNSGLLIVTDSLIGTGSQLKLLGQKLGANDSAWTITVRMRVDQEGGAYRAQGIFCYDSTTSKGYTFYFLTDNTDGSGLYHMVKSFTSNTSENDVTYNRQRNVPMLQYMRIERTAAKVINVYRSADGIGWSLYYSVGATSWMEGAGDRVNWVGLVWGGCCSSDLEIKCSYWWFRYNWTADFDATLNK